MTTGVPPVAPLTRLMSNIRREPESNCWVWLGPTNTSGYGIISTSAISKEPRAHRLSYMFFRGNIPAGMHVCHHCDNRRCVNPAHLFIGTNADNTRDRVKKGRTAGKLTISDVAAIRALRAAGASTKELATKYGVAQVTVRLIVRPPPGRNVWNFEGRAFAPGWDCIEGYNCGAQR